MQISESSYIWIYIQFFLYTLTAYPVGSERNALSVIKWTSPKAYHTAWSEFGIPFD